MVLYGIALLSLAILFIFLFFFIKGSAQKLQSAEIKSTIQELTEEHKDQKMFGFEDALITKLNIPKNKIRWFLLAERLLIIGGTILLYFLLGVIGLLFVAAIIMVLLMNGQVQSAIIKSGVNRIPNTVAFMDYFEPQIASGSSAEDAFSRYIETLSPENSLKPLLIEYYTAKKAGNMSYKTPPEIRDITSVFENAEYNERLGSDNYLYIIEQAKADLFQKSLYYQDYQTRVNEVIKPMKLAYYVIIPLIFFILWGTVGNFWFTPLGWVVAFVILFIFFIFNFLCNRLAINTLKTIIG